MLPSFYSVAAVPHVAAVPPDALSAMVRHEPEVHIQTHKLTRYLTKSKTISQTLVTREALPVHGVEGRNTFELV